MHRLIALCAALVFAAGLAYADESGPVYVGVAVGTTDYTLPCFGPPCDANKHRVSGKIYIGYTPSGFQLVDPNLVNSYELIMYSAGTNDGAYAKWTGGGDKVRFRGVGIVDSLSYRFDAFSLTGRLGVGDTQASLDRGGDYGYSKREEVGVVAGVGAAYAINNRWTFKADIDRVPSTNLDHKKSLNLFTLGVAYRF